MLKKKRNLLLLTTLTYIFEFQYATHACAFCFCLGVPRPFASDTSPKRIDREGLGKRRTGTGQQQADLLQDRFDSSVVKCITLLFNLFCSNDGKQVASFRCPFYRTFTVALVVHYLLTITNHPTLTHSANGLEIEKNQSIV